MSTFNFISFIVSINLILSNSISDVYVLDIFTRMITLTLGLQSHFQIQYSFNKIIKQKL